MFQLEGRVGGDEVLSHYITIDLIRLGLVCGLYTTQNGINFLEVCERDKFYDMYVFHNNKLIKKMSDNRLSESELHLYKGERLKRDLFSSDHYYNGNNIVVSEKFNLIIEYRYTPDGVKNRHIFSPFSGKDIFIKDHVVGEQHSPCGGYTSFDGKKIIFVGNNFYDEDLNIIVSSSEITKECNTSQHINSFEFYGDFFEMFLRTGTGVDDKCIIYLPTKKRLMTEYPIFFNYPFISKINHDKKRIEIYKINEGR